MTEPPGGPDQRGGTSSAPRVALTPAELNALLTKAKALAAACSDVFNSKMGSGYSLSTFDSDMQNANYIQLPNTPNGSVEASTSNTGPISGRDTTLYADFYLDTVDAERQPAVLAHENIHRYTGWTDADVFAAFQNSGMTPDEVAAAKSFHNTDGITTWILRGCKEK
jgi:hypothetical protein